MKQNKISNFSLIFVVLFVQMDYANAAVSHICLLFKCKLVVANKKFNTFQLSMKQFEKTLQMFRNACLPKTGASLGKLKSIIFSGLKMEKIIA